MRTVRLVLAACTLLAVAPPGAHADPPLTRGCSFDSVGNPINGGVGLQVGAVYSGPVVLDEVDAGLVSTTGTVTCTIQTYPNTHHADPDASVAATGPETPAVAVLPPTPISYELPADSFPVYCTRVDVAGQGAYYLTWDGWSRDSGAECLWAIQPGGPPPNELFPALHELGDPVWCETVGDSYVWSCAGYPGRPER